MNKSYHIKTFGCQMNKSDSERLATMMESVGYKPTSLKKASLVIFNTCSVRQMAEDRATGQIREAKKRQQNIVVTGCLKNQAGFDKKHPEVDIFIDIRDIEALPHKLEKLGSNKQHCGQCCHRKKTSDYLSIKPKLTTPAQAYVPIMTGCNNFCSYCIVPYVRGREKSRAPESIFSEIEELVSNGTKQITLLGQNVNSYNSGKTSFVSLLKKIAKMPGDFRVFFVTSHPKDFFPEIIDLVAKNKRLCPYFHLPIQSGSDRILKHMNRKYDIKKYLQIIDKIRKEIPKAAITTDIIVGYPGETSKDFAATKQICEQVKYDLAYIARYSPRPQTAAAKIDDDISPQEKKNREKILTEIVTKTALEQNQKFIGTTCDVLVETSNDVGEKFENYGKNEYFKTTKFPSSKSLKGKLVTVKVTEVANWGLKAELV